MILGCLSSPVRVILSGAKNLYPVVKTIRAAWGDNWKTLHGTQGLLIVVYSGASIPVILSGAKNLYPVVKTIRAAWGDNWKNLAWHILPFAVGRPLWYIMRRFSEVTRLEELGQHAGA